MEKIRKIIRELVESEVFNEGKKKKKDSSFYGMPIFQRTFFPSYIASADQDVDDGLGVDSDDGSDGGGMDEGIKGVYASGLSIDDMYNNVPPIPTVISQGSVNESEENITTLNFFDFDGTLINSMNPEEGKKKYKEITGEDYPHVGWWGKKDSLEPFDNKPIKNVVAEYNKRKGEPQSKTILLTNRIKELSDVVKEILDTNNLTFDDYNLREGGQEKAERIKEYLKKYPTVKNINVYDDRDTEIAMFKDLKKELEKEGIILNIFQVKKS